MPGDPFDRMNAAQPAQQVRPDLDQLADGIMNSPEAMKLFQHIFGTLNQPMPQPPTAPAQQGLGLVQSVAGALNPQFAPLFLQQQNAQANAQFGVQQRAFEEAMQGRRAALAAGASLVNSGIRADGRYQSPIGPEAGFRPQTEVVHDEAGNLFLLSTTLGRQGVGETTMTPMTPGVDTPVGRLSRANARVFDEPGGRATFDPSAPRLGTKPLASAGGAATTTTTDDRSEPRPRAGDVEAVNAAAVLEQTLNDYESGAAAYKGGERPFGTTRAFGQAVTRKLPVIGQELSESFGDSDFEILSAQRDRIGRLLARLVDSGRLSDYDVQFALENLPTVASLTTEAGRTQAKGKIALVRQEMKRRMEERLKLQPELSGGVNTAAPSTGGKRIRRSNLSKLPPEEQQRAVREGWTIIED